MTVGVTLTLGCELGEANGATVGTLLKVGDAVTVGTELKVGDTVGDTVGDPVRHGGSSVESGLFISEMPPSQGSMYCRSRFLPISDTL